MKYIILGILLLIIIGGGSFYFLNHNKTAYNAPLPTLVPTATTTPATNNSTEQLSTTTKRSAKETIGKSIEGNDIVAYHFGNGTTELLFIGGVHGGYSWNTAQVAFELIDELEANPSSVPENMSITIIPVMNPDGLKRITGSTGRFETKDVSGDTTTKIAARFNANEVDLNRNFDCEWSEKGTWQSRTVSGGTQPLSEPEAKAIADYVAAYPPTAAVVWYSAAGGVYAATCDGEVTTDTRMLMETYAQAANYEADDSFDFYAITGDMVNWFAKEKIDAISVLLTDHTNTEWSKNWAGIEAIINLYAE